MKKILTTLILLTAFAAAKAQTPYIKISYDANGNRILRAYVPGRPAPPETDNDAALETPAIAANELPNSDALTALQTPSFQVYPNPSDNNFNIALNEVMLQSNCEIVLTDQLGKVHLRKALTDAVTTISTQHLADGVYYIVVNSGKSKSSTRIVKQSK